MQLTLGEAAGAMSGTLPVGGAELCFEGIAVDSRRLSGGELFFALAGEQSDGHRFLASARDGGAVAAVVSRTSRLQDDWSIDGTVLPHVLVDDTYVALHDLTRAVRQRAPEHLIGITGSAGKTTTKVMMAQLLSTRYRCAASPGNLNNLYGFPISLLSIPGDTEWMVAEMGMSTPGELGGVSRLGRPDIAVFTNVREAHLEAFDERAESEGGSATAAAGREQIAEAKAELLEGLDASGLVVANAADPWVMWIAEKHRRRGGRCVGFRLGEAAPEGRHLECPLRVEDLVGDPAGSRFRLIAESGESVEVHLPLHGAVQVENFLAAATCAVLLGCALPAIAEAATRLRPERGRGAILRIGGALVVDDTYNSNPSALTAALRAAAELPGERHVAILGEMRELGRSSEELHRAAGERVAKTGFDLLWCVGEQARWLHEAAGAAGVESRWFSDRQASLENLDGLLRAGDVLLVKGSRGVGLEELVDRLLAAEATEAVAMQATEGGV